MIIKQPDSNNALVSLWKIIDDAKDLLTNCMNQNHDNTVVLYVSSLIISSRVIHNGKNLLNEISNLVSIAPKNCICVVRTNTPNYFPSFMAKWQTQSINALRGQCYVIQYPPKRTFLNHAKFLLHYHVCFSEKIVDHGKFFGSTNLTLKGLSNPKPRGNYEEYWKNSGTKRRLSSTDGYYLQEVLDLITYKASLYTSSQFLNQNIEEHKHSLQNLLNMVGDITGNFKTGFPDSFLYDTYVRSLELYNQTFALFSEMPGKTITNEIINDLISESPPKNPFEIDMMTLDTEYYDVTNEIPEFAEELPELLEKKIYSIRKALELITEKYQPAIENINNYFDEKELLLINYIEEHNEKQVYNIERMLNSISEGWTF